MYKNKLSMTPKLLLLMNKKYMKPKLALMGILALIMWSQEKLLDDPTNQPSTRHATEQLIAYRLKVDGEQ